MRRFLFSVFGAALLLLLLTVSAFAADGTTYRALLIASDTKSLGAESLGNGPINDCNNFTQILCRSQNVSADDITLIEPRASTGKQALSSTLSSIAGAFADSDEDDVNILYFSGHGIDLPDRSGGMIVGVGYYSYYTLSAQTLRQVVADNSLKGTFVIIADCCFSGGLIGKGASDGAEGFAERFCSSFSEELTLCGENLEGCRFKVLCASGYQQASMQWDENGAFTTALCFGLGVYPFAKTPEITYDCYPADRDSDGCVTLAEAYCWAKLCNVLSDARLYPEYDDIVLVRYDRSAHPGAGIVSMKLLTPVVTASADAKLVLSYETVKDCMIDMTAPMYADMADLSTYYANDVLPLSMCFGSQNMDLYEPNAYLHLTLTASQYDAQRDLYYDTDEIPIDLSGVQPGLYYIRLLGVCGGSGAAILLPLQVIGQTAEPNSFGVTLSEKDYRTDPVSCHELRIAVKFAESVAEEYMPVSGVQLDCVITDGEKTVRTLAERQSALYVGSDLELPDLMRNYDGVNELYWDGRDENGRYVPSGTYTVSVTATYGTGQSAVRRQSSTRITVTTPAIRKAELTASGLSLTVSALQSHTALAAEYDTDGRLTAVYSRSFSGADKTERDESIAFSPKSGCTYGVYLLENGKTLLDGIKGLLSA